MSKKKPRNTKSKIIAAAWKLFYEQGYEETTLEEIILESGTSKGSFYHYFDGKDALLESLSFLFDEKYEELEPQLARFETYFEQLIFLNQELFTMIENTIAIDLLSRLLSTQLDDGEPASAGPQAHLLPPAPPHHRRGPGGGRADPEPQRQRHGEGLRPL